MAILVGSAGIFAGVRAYREFDRNKQIAQEIRALQDEADRVDRENRKLRDRIDYLQSDSFREQEAKRVLEYRKKGERVVFIRDRGSALEASANAENSSRSSSFGEEIEADFPNYLKWWNRFFGPKETGISQP